MPRGKYAGAKLGDFCTVFNRKNGKFAHAIFAEVGPAKKIGEGSIALAKMLDVDACPKKGGTPNGIAYILFPGSGNGKPRSNKDITSESQKLFKAWGGVKRLIKLFPQSR